MKKLCTKIIMLVALVASVSMMPTVYAQTTGTDVYLTLTGGNITIGATGSVNMGTLTVSSSSTTVDRQFTAAGDEYFWVEDLLGADAGYYTTIQATDLVHQTNASLLIPAANVSLKVDPLTVTTMAGSTNAGVTLPAGLVNYTSLGTAVTFVERAAGANFGVVGKYGILPWVEILIPAFQAVGTYQGTLVFTLFS